MTRTPSFIFEKASAFSQFSVSGVTGGSDRHEVCRGVELVGGLGALDARLAETLLPHVQVECDHAHPERERALRHELTDAADPCP